MAREKAGIDDFRFHNLRLTFATRLAQRGVDLYTISKLLGHVNITMTRRYAHHCPESLRAGIAILEKVDYNERKQKCFKHMKALILLDNSGNL
ncbi:tyrosine-type recombinase/integrase [Candidatus Jettenia sp. AMX1]